MTKQPNTITAKQIRELNINIETWVSFDFENDTYFLVLDGKRSVSFLTRKAQINSYNKIRRMGLGLGGNKIHSGLTDEDQGIIQAVEIGENPFSGVTIKDKY